MHYSDCEGMNPFISTVIQLFLRIVMGNFQFSFIVSTKMFSELIQCVIMPGYSAVCHMHESRFDKNDVYLRICVCLTGNQAQYNVMPTAASEVSFPSISAFGRAQI